MHKTCKNLFQRLATALNNAFKDSALQIPGVLEKLTYRQSPWLACDQRTPHWNDLLNESTNNIKHQVYLVYPYVTCREGQLEQEKNCKSKLTLAINLRLSCLASSILLSAFECDQDE
jgi:predicted nucleotidyltransferase